MSGKVAFFVALGLTFVIVPSSSGTDGPVCNVMISLRDLHIQRQILEGLKQIPPDRRSETVSRQIADLEGEVAALTLLVTDKDQPPNNRLQWFFGLDDQLGKNKKVVQTRIRLHKRLMIQKDEKLLGLLARLHVPANRLGLLVLEIASLNGTDCDPEKAAAIAKIFQTSIHKLELNDGNLRLILLSVGLRTDRNLRATFESLKAFAVERKITLFGNIVLGFLQNEDPYFSALTQGELRQLTEPAEEIGPAD